MTSLIHILIVSRGNGAALEQTLHSCAAAGNTGLTLAICSEREDRQIQAVLQSWPSGDQAPVYLAGAWPAVLASQLESDAWIMVLNEGDVLLPGALDKLQTFDRLHPEGQLLEWQPAWYVTGSRSLVFTPGTCWSPRQHAEAGYPRITHSAVRAEALRAEMEAWQAESDVFGYWELERGEQWCCDVPLTLEVRSDMPLGERLVVQSLASLEINSASDAAPEVTRLQELHTRRHLAARIDACRTYTQLANTRYSHMTDALAPVATLFDGSIGRMLADRAAWSTTLEIESRVFASFPAWLALFRAHWKVCAERSAVDEPMRRLELQLNELDTEGGWLPHPSTRRVLPAGTGGSGQPASRRLRLGFLTSDEPDWACVRLRVIDPLSLLAPWVDTQLFPGRFIMESNPESTDIDAFAAWADVFVVQRAALGDHFRNEWHKLLESGKPIIFELDDWLAGLPAGHLDSAYYDTRELAHSWERQLPLCTLAVASTENLAHYLKKWNMDVRVLPNSLAQARWQSLPQTEKDERVVTIGFAGGGAHDSDLKMIAQALWQVRDMLGEDQIHLVFWGVVPPPVFEGAKNVRIVDKRVNYYGYLQELAGLNLDIGIAPLEDNHFNACKSDLKWLEYSAVGAATLASDVIAFREPRELGLAEVVPNDTASWVAALLRLIKDKEYRQTLSRRSREYLATQARLETQVGHWVEVLRSVVSKPLQRLLDGYSPNSLGALRNHELHYHSFTKSLQWKAWQDRHSLREVDAEMMAERMVSEWPNRPFFNLIMPVRRSEAELLLSTMDSMGSQLYPYWRLIIVADWPQSDPAFGQTATLVWKQVATLDDPVALVQGINNLLVSYPADWVMWIQAGCRLVPQALLRFGDAIHAKAGTLAVYSDHDHYIHAGFETAPALKPDFSLDYLRSYDYVGKTVAMSYQGLTALGGFEVYPGVEVWNHLLRLAENYGLEVVAHVDDVLLHLPPQSETVDDRHLATKQVALENHLARLNISATVSPGYVADSLHVEYAVTGTPLVSVIVPTRDKLEYLRPCVDSLFEKTRYAYFELIIVDNRSADPDTHAYYRELEAQYPGQVRIAPYDAPFNFSAQCNVGVEVARGDYILLLNNDTEVLHDTWLERMIGIAQRPEVGAVGARLIYPESGRIQHAGIVLGLPGGALSVADHVFGKSDMNDPRYMNRLLTEQNYSAVTAACLMVSKDKYLAVGGLDAEKLTVLFNDVDFCLKLQKQGLINVYTPYVTLAHHHAKSIGRVTFDPTVALEAAAREQKELAVMLERWLPVLARDPGYNRHLTLQQGDMSVELDRALPWTPGIGSRKKVLGLPIAGGSGEYRVGLPFYALQQSGRLDTAFISPKKGNNTLQPSVVELKRLAPDALLVHSVLRAPMQYSLEQYRRFMPEMEIIFGLDDLVGALPEKSILSRVWRKTMPDARANLRKVLRLSDRLIVSTEPLAEVCRDMIGDIHVVPNRLPKHLWGDLHSLSGVGRKPRVGWVGAMQHQGDLSLIIDVVKATAEEVEWVFMGMCLPEIRPYIAEEYPCVSFLEYPAKMAALNLDLAVAPLEENPFNEAKSNLRLLEYGVMGWPVVCTDIYPYQTNNAPVCRVPNTPQAWINAIRERVYDLDAARREGDRLQAWVTQNYFLEDHLDDWCRALTGSSAKKM